MIQTSNAMRALGLDIQSSNSDPLTGSWAFKAFQDC